MISLCISSWWSVTAPHSSPPLSILTSSVSCFTVWCAPLSRLSLYTPVLRRTLHSYHTSLDHWYILRWFTFLLLEMDRYPYLCLVKHTCISFFIIFFLCKLHVLNIVSILQHIVSMLKDIVHSYVSVISWSYNHISRPNIDTSFITDIHCNVSNLSPALWRTIITLWIIFMKHCCA